MTEQMRTERTDPIDVFCVGLGRQFSSWLSHVLVESPCAEVRAICDLAPERLDAARQRLGVGPRTFASFPELLEHARRASDPSRTILVVSTPPNRHFEMAYEALKSGFHVYVDKPLTPDLASARTLVELAGQGGCALVVGAQRRFEGVFQSIRDLAAKVGNVERLHMHSHGAFKDPDLDSPENDIIPSGIGYHVVDTLCWLARELGGEPAADVLTGASWRRSRERPEHRSAFEALLRFDFGERAIPVSIAASDLAPPDSVDEVLTVTGERGQVRYERVRAPRDSEPGRVTCIEWDDDRNVSVGEVHVDSGPARGMPLAAALEAIHAGRMDGLRSTGEDALVTLGIIDAIMTHGAELG